jgi:hypothetical protein
MWLHAMMCNAMQHLRSSLHPAIAIPARFDQHAWVPSPPLLLCQVIFWICVLVWLINYHHFLVLHWVDDSPFPDLASSTFNLAKCTYYFKIAGMASGQYFLS